MTAGLKILTLPSTKFSVIADKMNKTEEDAR
jgi:hypothetical protein